MYSRHWNTHARPTRGNKSHFRIWSQEAYGSVAVGVCTDTIASLEPSWHRNSSWQTQKHSWHSAYANYMCEWKKWSYCALRKGSCGVLVSCWPEELGSLEPASWLDIHSSPWHTHTHNSYMELPHVPLSCRWLGNLSNNRSSSEPQMRKYWEE